MFFFYLDLITGSFLDEHYRFLLRWVKSMPWEDVGLLVLEMPHGDYNIILESMALANADPSIKFQDT